MANIFHQSILEKLAVKHNVSEREVNECFSNRIGQYLIDPREDHQTDPPTLWFVSETNYGRKLKVIFVCRDGNNYIKSAYTATQEIERIYNKYGK